MKILFRVDAYSGVGLGHIVRSIAIAVRIKHEVSNVDILFFGMYNKVAIGMIRGHSIDYRNTEISDEELEIEFAVKKHNPDVLFIDKLFNYSASLVERLKLKTRVVMFHNLCDGQYNVDDFILPSAHTSFEVIENPLWGKNDVNFYHGAKYIPINRNIREIRKSRNNKISPEKAKNVVITSGGSDPKGVLIKILSWLIELEIWDVNITALVGASFVHSDKLEVLKSKLPSNINIEPFDYKCFIDADVAISTFGVTTYELIYLGIPTLSVGHAMTNAIAADRLAQQHGVISSLGFIDDITPNKFINGFYSLINKKYAPSDFEKLTSFVDGEGVARIVQIILRRA